MSEYKRLTERDEWGNADIIGVDSGNLQGNLMGDEFNNVTLALNRLAFFEDKIESGQGFIVPCNVGETVWYLNTIPSMNLARNTIYEGKLVRYHILNYPQPLGICVCADIQICNEYGTTEVLSVQDFGKIWFTDKSQAEARLKELKGENKQ